MRLCQGKSSEASHLSSEAHLLGESHEKESARLYADRIDDRVAIIAIPAYQD
jgi:hypothetical protein